MSGGASTAPTPTVSPVSLREHFSPLRVASFRYFFIGEVVGLSVPAINKLRLVGPAAKSAQSV